MACIARPLQASFALDIIVEEDKPSTINSFGLSEKSFVPNDTSTQPTACATILRKYVQPASEGPQFLHGGKWPRCLPSSAIAGVMAELQGLSLTFTPESDSDHEYPQDVIKGNNSETERSDTDEPVTADQMSMVMDYWDPDELPNPFALLAKSPSTSFLDVGSDNPRFTAKEQSLFLREIMAEHLTRLQTVECVDELEDNDSVVEMVASLEGYRQNGWAEEMVIAFPRECLYFWTISGIDSLGQVAALERQ